MEQLFDKLTAEVLKRTREAVESFGMFDGTKRLLVAFSGGADSTVLLYVMRALSEEYGIEIAAAHVDHMIRGEEADRDRIFCEKTAESLKIKLHVLRCDVPAIAKAEKLSLEEAARNVRYKFFEELMDKHGYDRTATAHHAGDNAETLLFNLIRGTSPDGVGIPPVRDRYIRPLIGLKKSALVSFCETNGIEYVTDSTNAETDYTRNYIRHIIIPECEKINEGAVDAFTHFCTLTRADNEYLNREAAKIPCDADAETLRELPDVLLGRFIRLRYNEVSPETQLTYVQIRSVSELVRNRSLNRSISLSGGITCTLQRNGLFFSKEKSEKPEFEYMMSEGALYIKETGDTVVIYRKCEDEDEISQRGKYIKDLINIYRLFIHKSVNSDKISKDIKIRSRLSGDRVKIGGMTRTPKKLYQARRMAPSQSDVLPFFCDDDGKIIWIPGFDVSDHCRPSADGETVELYYFTGRKAEAD